MNENAATKVKKALVIIIGYPLGVFVLFQVSLLFSIDVYHQLPLLWEPAQVCMLLAITVATIYAEWRLANSNSAFSIFETSCAKCGAVAPAGRVACHGCGEPYTPKSERRTRGKGDFIYLSIIPVLYLMMWPLYIGFRIDYDRYRETVTGCKKVKSDLANYAIYAEVYFTENNSYTTAVEGDGILGFHPSPGGEILGFRRSSEVHMAHAPGSPTTEGYTVTGAHLYCDENNDGRPDVFTWDSTNGGMQE